MKSAICHLVSEMKKAPNSNYRHYHKLMSVDSYTVQLCHLYIVKSYQVCYMPYLTCKNFIIRWLQVHEYWFRNPWKHWRFIYSTKGTQMKKAQMHIQSNLFSAADDIIREKKTTNKHMILNNFSSFCVAIKL